MGGWTFLSTASLYGKNCTKLCHIQPDACLLPLVDTFCTTVILTHFKVINSTSVPFIYSFFFHFFTFWDKISVIWSHIPGSDLYLTQSAFQTFLFSSYDVFQWYHQSHSHLQCSMLTFSSLVPPNLNITSTSLKNFPQEISKAAMWKNLFL